MVLEDSSFLLFWEELVKPAIELLLFGFALLVLGFSCFFSFVEWTGLGLQACSKEHLKDWSE